MLQDHEELASGRGDEHSTGLHGKQGVSASCSPEAQVERRHEESGAERTQTPSGDRVKSPTRSTAFLRCCGWISGIGCGRVPALLGHVNRNVEYIVQEVEEALLPAVQNQAGNTSGDILLKLFYHLFIFPTHINDVFSTNQALSQVWGC